MAIDTRANLIEVATNAFARDGFATTSLRSIAKEAGVSPALVVHHFGSREKLVEECIVKSLGLWVSEKQQFVDVSLSTSLSQWQSSVDQHGSKLQFFRQVLLAGGEPANILFSRMVQEAQMVIDSQVEKGQIRKLENRDDLALLMTLNGLAPLLLQEQMANLLGQSLAQTGLTDRLAKTTDEVYRRGIYKSSDSGSGKKKKKKSAKKQG
jgi:AcrR family transcriptional regulator